MPAVSPLHRDALSIWRAGVDAVDSARLVRNVVRSTDSSLSVCDVEISLDRVDRIVVVGAGKAGAGMAAAFEEAASRAGIEEKVSGWINVPDDCLRSLEKIHLHPARPAGWNEPTEQGVAGSLKILDLISELGPSDVCVVLLSGGGSALLPAPVDEISLADKQAVTRLLMNSGATIGELNCVRKQLSRTKGGRLARATNAGLVLTLIISDVVNDPLDVIASGPTVADSSTAADALEILNNFSTDPKDVPAAVWSYLNKAAQIETAPTPLPTSVHNFVIGNNALALDAAAIKARELGYRVRSLGSENEGEARHVGCELAELALEVRDNSDPISAPACILSGGEPIVHLAKTDRPRRGGRNQELILAAAERLWDESLDRIVLLSGGTDGEDGPTDAAGAWLDAKILDHARSKNLIPTDYLAINNSYSFFDQIGGLLKTGPTHTNVMDLRVVLVADERRA